MKIVSLKQQIYIYFSIFSIFSIFYLTLFYFNRIEYLKVNLKNNEARIMQNVIIKANFVNSLNSYHLKSFIRYFELIKTLYIAHDKELDSIISREYIYDFAGIVTSNNKYKFANDKSFINIIDFNRITSLDSVSIFIKYIPEKKTTYKIFVKPLLVKGKLDAFLVAYLNINDMLDYNNFYLVSKTGTIVNNYVIDYFNYGENIFFVFPDEWNAMGRTDNGQIISNNGIFTYATLDSPTRMSHMNVFQDRYYLLSIYPINPNDSPYFIKSFRSFIKYIDFKTNIIYWIMGYFWIAGVSIFIYIVILGRIEQGRFASFDYMTGALNRRGGDVKINAIINEYSARGLSRILKCIKSSIIYFRKPIYSIHIAVVDINGLKQVNDNLGHKYGDELIVDVANYLKKFLNKSELLVRMGGDEFMILFINRKETNIDTYWTSVNNLFAYQNSLNIKKYSVDISYGVVKYNGVDSLEEHIKLADDLMYKYKKRHKVNLFFN